MSDSEASFHTTGGDSPNGNNQQVAAKEMSTTPLSNLKINILEQRIKSIENFRDDILTALENVQQTCTDAMREVEDARGEIAACRQFQEQLDRRICVLEGRRVEASEDGQRLSKNTQNGKVGQDTNEATSLFEQQAFRLESLNVELKKQVSDAVQDAFKSFGGRLDVAEGNARRPLVAKDIDSPTASHSSERPSKGSPGQHSSANRSTLDSPNQRDASLKRKRSTNGERTSISGLRSPFKDTCSPDSGQRSSSLAGGSDCFAASASPSLTRSQTQQRRRRDSFGDTAFEGDHPPESPLQSASGVREPSQTVSTFSMSTKRTEPDTRREADERLESTLRSRQRTPHPTKTLNSSLVDHFKNMTGACSEIVESPYIFARFGKSPILLPLTITDSPRVCVSLVAAPRADSLVNSGYGTRYKTGPHPDDHWLTMDISWPFDLGYDWKRVSNDVPYSFKTTKINFLIVPKEDFKDGIVLGSRDLNKINAHFRWDSLEKRNYLTCGLNQDDRGIYLYRTPYYKRREEEDEPLGPFRRLCRLAHWISTRKNPPHAAIFHKIREYEDGVGGNQAPEVSDRFPRWLEPRQNRDREEDADDGYSPTRYSEDPYKDLSMHRPPNVVLPSDDAGRELSHGDPFYQSRTQSGERDPDWQPR